MVQYVRSLGVVIVLVSLLGVGPSLAAAPQQTAGQSQGQSQGNPSTKVWVNSKSSVYHCPGTRYYGTTKSGQYMTQAEAQKARNRPAYGKYCS